MSDWNKNQDQPPDEDDDLNLDWLKDEFKKGEPGKPAGDRTGLTGELPWLQGDETEESGAEPDQDDESPGWKVSKKGIEPSRSTGETLGITGALDWRKASPEPGGDTGAGDEDHLMPWQSSSETGERPPEETTTERHKIEADWLQAADAETFDAAALPELDADADWMAEMESDEAEEAPAHPSAAQALTGAEIPDWLQDLGMPETPAEDLEALQGEEWSDDFAAVGADEISAEQTGWQAETGDEAQYEYADETACGDEMQAGEYSAEYADETQYDQYEYGEQAYQEAGGYYDESGAWVETPAGEETYAYDEPAYEAEAYAEPEGEAPPQETVDWSQWDENAAGEELPAAVPSTATLEPLAEASWMDEEEAGAVPGDEFAAATEAAEDDDFGWLEDMEVPAAETPASGAVPASVPDWLAEMGPPVPAQEEAVEADEMDFDALFGEEEEAAVPGLDADYLQSMLAGEKDDSEDWFGEEAEPAGEGEPDWLASLEDISLEDVLPETPPAKTAPKAAAPPPPAQEDIDLDSLLDSLEPAAPLSRPGMTAELTGADLDALFGEEEEELPAVRAPAAAPDFADMLEETGEAAPAAPADLPEDTFEVPDWLREAASSTEAGMTAAALIRQQKDRPLSELDERLQALRETGLSLAAERQDDPESHRRIATVLPGVKEALAPGDVRFEESGIATALQITPQQEQKAALLMSLVGTSAATKVLLAEDGKMLDEAQPQAQPQRRRTVRRLFAGTERAVITLLLALAVMGPFFVEFGSTGSTLPPFFPPGSDGAEAFNWIDALEPDSRVLVAVEYGPTGAAELDSLTGVLLTHLLQQGARPVLVSTNPAGLLHADHLIAGLAGETTRNRAYFTVAYLPGGAMGLRNLAGDAGRVLATDVRGGNTGLAVKSLNDFVLIVIITENAENLRAWMEQVLPSASVPLVVASGYAALPLIQPYIHSAASRIPLLVGFNDAYTYTVMLSGGVVVPPVIETTVPPPTIEPTLEATQQAVETAEVVATEVVATSVPPTATPVPPTATPVPPTNTPELPTATPTIAPTNTPAATATPTLTSSPTETPTPSLIEVGTIVADTRINARNGPGTTFGVIGQLAPGDRVEVIGYNERRDWVNVILPDGQAAWVAAFLMEIQQVPASDFQAPRRQVDRRHPGVRRSGNRQRDIRQAETPTLEVTLIPSNTPTPTRTPTPTLTPTATVTPSPTPFIVAVQAAPIPSGETRRDAMTMGTLAAILLITLGNIYYIGRWLLKRGE